MNTMHQDKTIFPTNRQRAWLRRVLINRLKSTFALPAIGAGLFVAAAAMPARAAYDSGAGTWNVANETELIQAINDLNDGTANGMTTISFSNSITLDNSNALDMPLIAEDVIIEGNNFALDANSTRAFMVGDGSTSIDVSFNNLTITGALAKGGDGGFGKASSGGGGAGLGGAVFVNAKANVTLNSVSFQDNVARGGDGGEFGYYATSGGSGGGAMNGGNGGDSSAFYDGDGGGGGGGGLDGDGGEGDTVSGGGGGTSNGNPGGGSGGDVDISVAGSNAVFFGGGGGGGAITTDAEGANGGNGDYGGGGGGTALEDGGDGGFGGGAGGGVPRDNRLRRWFC